MVAQYLSKPRGETQTHRFEDSAGKAHDAARGNRRHGAISYFPAGQPHYRPACACRWRLRASRSRPNVTLILSFRRAKRRGILAGLLSIGLNKRENKPGSLATPGMTR